MAIPAKYIQLIINCFLNNVVTVGIQKDLSNISYVNSALCGLENEMKSRGGTGDERKVSPD